MKTIVMCVCAVAIGFAFWLGLSAMAEAQGSDSAPSVTQPSANQPQPTGMLHDPTTDPTGSISDVKAARKYGWPIVVLVILRGLLLIAGRWVPWLRSGKRALLVAAGVTALGAGFDAAVAGGSMMAVAIAIAASALWFAEASYKPKDKSSGLVETL